jgi:hypothetical protein
VGLDLVANLGLFLQYATMVEQTVSFWTATVQGLEAATTSPDNTTSPDTQAAFNTSGEGWQAYSDIISPVRDEYRELFPLSTDPSPDAIPSLEEMLLSGEYEYLETEEGYVIVSRRIPLSTSPDGLSRRRRALRYLLPGRESQNTSSGMRGLLMWDCSRKPSKSIAGDGSSGQKKRRPSRTLSFRRTPKRATEDEEVQAV